MDAAVNVLVKQGYANTTVADIAEAAGAAKGTFYRYFRSKDELIASLREEFLHDFLADVAEQTGAVAMQGWQKQIEVFIDLFMEAVLANRSFHEVIFHSGPWGGKPLREDDSPVVQWLTNFIRAGIGAQVMEAASPDVTAVLLFGASHQAVDAAMPLSSDDRERIRVSLLNIFEKALAPQVDLQPM